MLKKIFLFAFANIFVIATSFVSASAQDFQTQCEGDIETYCASVTPGDGRLATCLYSHSDRISDACHEATAAVGVILESFFDRISTTYESCSGDIHTYCDGVAAGGGRIMACLMQNSAEIEPECLENVESFSASMLQ